jgi:hypothetical protein
MGRISFRRSQRLGSDGTVKLEVPQDSLQRRPSQKEEIHLVRRALKNNSTRVGTLILKKSEYLAIIL